MVKSNQWLNWQRACCCLIGLSVSIATCSAGEVDLALAKENQSHGVKQQPLASVDDNAFLRRIYVDLISRIPTDEEIREYQSWPAVDRRTRVVEKLMSHERFADRWTTFFSDMLRLRSNTPGGAALIGYVHKSLVDGMPYDELCRRLISINGKANKTPEVGFILGDDADPLAMASVTSQVFMGVRIGCAQCHDHPFDVWKREDFYGMAAYFGKTRRVESQLTRVVYTMEADQSVVLWPPEGEAEMKDRKPMTPRFPLAMSEDNGTLKFIQRLAATRDARKPKATAKVGQTVDDLLADVDDKVKKTTSASFTKVDPVAEAKKDIRKIDIEASLNSPSELRQKLAELVTSPRNRYFARALVNRVWKELIGRGFVEPIDDFRKDNPASHPQTLDFLSEEFVARGYDLKALIKMIVTSDAYSRAHAPRDADEATRGELEASFLATPMRRMISEALYDSVVTAGHVFEFKHPAGENELVLYDKVRVPKSGKVGSQPKAAALLTQNGNGGAMMADKMAAKAGGGAYALEDAIEIDFQKVLSDNDADVDVDQMMVMSNEQLEAERMMRERMAGGMDYEEKLVKRVVDANPKFNTSLRMESPAQPNHFLRVFGQPTRQDLGEARDETPSMRQALLMLNGKLTHEASRVGKLEPVYSLLVGEKKDLVAAIRLSYREIMTREPNKEELAEGQEIVSAAANPVDGIGDLRWVLLNCNEFRFLP